MKSCEKRVTLVIKYVTIQEAKNLREVLKRMRKYGYKDLSEIPDPYTHPNK